MPISILNEELVFPSTSQATTEGMLAIGGDLSTERLLLAYQHGIFPWFNEDEPIVWWSPDPRFVLEPHAVKISKSMRSLLKKERFKITINKNFEAVISNCSAVPRKDQEGTWITNDMTEAYIKLHKLGWAHSFEAWSGSELIGGLYGVAMGTSFFGESMFSKITNASKFAFIKCCQLLEREQFDIIDCQIHSSHLESLGAHTMRRTTFENIIKKEPVFTTSTLKGMSETL